MKIIASKRDDLLKEKEEYDAKMAKRQAKSDEEEKLFRKAERDSKDLVKQRVLNLIGETTLPLEISVDRNYSFQDDGRDTWEVRVQVSGSIFAEERALSWNWTAKIKDGQVAYDSGSWSGLKACTVEQLDDLKESVRILEKLMNADWKSILVAPAPRYGDYVDFENERAMRSEYRNFDKELMELDISEAIGTDKVLKIQNMESQRWAGRGYFWMQIVSESEKFYTINIVPDRYLDNPEYRDGKSAKELMDSQYPEKKRKDTVVQALVKPLEIKDLSEFK